MASEIRQTVVVDLDADGVTREGRKATEAVRDLDQATDRAAASADHLGDKADRAARETDQLGRKARESGGHMSRLSSITSVFAGVGLVEATRKAFEFGSSSVEAFRESEAAMARAETTLDKNVAGWRRHRGEIDNVIQKHMALGAFDDDDLYESLANLTRVTKDTDQAFRLQSIAMDLARGKNISLAKATGVIAKVAAGNTSALGRMGIQIEKGTSATEALGIVQRQYAGQAKVFGDSNAGAAEKISVGWGNFKETVGSALIPFVSALMGAVVQAMPTIQAYMQRVADTVRENWPQIRASALEVAAGIKGLWVTVKPLAILLVQALGGIVEVVKDNWGTISTVISTVAKIVGIQIKAFVAVARVEFAVISAVIGTFIEVVEGIVGAVRATVTAVQAAFRAMRTAVDAVLTAPIAFAGWLNDQIIRPITGAAGTASSAAAGLARSVWQGITGVGGDMAAWIQRTVITPITGAFGEVLQRGTALAQNMWTGLRSVVGTMVDYIRDRVISPITDRLPAILSKGKDVAEEVWRGIRSFTGDMVGYIRDNIIEPITNRLGAILSKGEDIAGAIKDGMVKGAREVVGAVRTAFTTFLNSIIGLVNRLPFVNIPKLAEGGVVSGPTFALVGEDGPEVVVPLGSKRKARGRELLGQAAGILGMGGNLGEPNPSAQGAKDVARSLGLPMFGLGGWVLDKAKDAGVAVGRAALDNLPGAGAATGAIYDTLARLAKGGAGALLGALPGIPNFPEGAREFGGQLATGIRGAAARYIEGIFTTKDSWGNGNLGVAKLWGQMAVNSGRYLWGGGHGGWDFNLPKGYDCSGFASHLAKRAGSTISAPGTTGSTMGQASHVSRSPGSAPFLWGWRGMDSGDPRRQHMGARILGTWLSFGPAVGDSRWDWYGIPPGLPGYESGIPYVPHTGPAVLHAGEAVLNRDQADAYRAGAGGGVTINVHPAMSWLKDFIEVTVDAASQDSNILARAGGYVR